jgi:murein DD-endopeptidase MepM/ murein hydrolase activator NlpD
MLAAILVLGVSQVASADLCLEKGQSVKQLFITSDQSAGMDSALFPLSAPSQNDYTKGVSSFGSPRARKIKSAAVNLKADSCDPVLAMSPGVIIQGPYRFYDNTYAIEIKHDDGTIVRYAELSGDLVEGVKVGAEVEKGQIIGFVGELRGEGLAQLHLEMFSGKEEGPLTVSKGEFRRRGDLMNPTGILIKAEQNSFLLN